MNLQLITDIANIATAIIAISSIIAALTPTPKDDVWISKLYRIIDIMAVNIGKAKM
jgi:hypothetical protein